jgi:hypothetical protein
MTRWLRLAIFSQAAWLAIFPAGCGTGAYEQRVDERLKNLNRTGPFTALGDPVEIPGTPVKIRLPKSLGTEPLKDDANKLRLQPSLLPIAFVRTFEKQERTTTNVVANWYCYLFARKTTNNFPKTTADQILNHFKRIAPDAKAEWEDVECNTPDLDAAGKLVTVSWKRLRVKAEQVYDQGGDNFQPGQVNFEVWLHYSQGHTVLVGWSLPISIESAVPKFSEWAQLTAGTVQIAAGE